jgi:hypothetical protein
LRNNAKFRIKNLANFYSCILKTLGSSLTTTISMIEIKINIFDRKILDKDVLELISYYNNRYVKNYLFSP